MESKYRAVDQRPPEDYPLSPRLSRFSQQPIGDEKVLGASVVTCQHRPVVRPSSSTDMGIGSTINMEGDQMGGWNHSVGAMNTDVRCTANRISNLEVDLILKKNNSLGEIQYDAIQRQLEKQRIREEIIAAEIERRRMLELEVRRELDQEWAMAATQQSAVGFPFKERSPAWFDQRFSFVDRVDDRFTRDPWGFRGHARADRLPSRYPLWAHPGATQPGFDSEASRNSVIMLAKPSPNLSGAKRKHNDTPSGQSSQEPTFDRNRIPKEEHSCALCKVSTTSAKALNDHLQGKKHRMMEEQLRAGKIERKKAPNSKFLKGKAVAGSRKDTKVEAEKNSIQQQPMQDMKDNNGIGSGKDDKPKIVPKVEMIAPKVEIHPQEPNKKRKRTFKFWCEPCGVGAYCEAVFEAHKNGKKHFLNGGGE